MHYIDNTPLTDHTSFKTNFISTVLSLKRSYNYVLTMMLLLTVIMYKVVIIRIGICSTAHCSHRE